MNVFVCVCVCVCVLAVVFFFFIPEFIVLSKENRKEMCFSGSWQNQERGRAISCNNITFKEMLMPSLKSQKNCI